MNSLSLSNFVFIRILVRIVFRNQKMNKYEYRIPLFGPNYSNSRIVRIIRPNTAVYSTLVQCTVHITGFYLSGHEDGKVKLWLSQRNALSLLTCLDTARYFTTDDFRLATESSPVHLYSTQNWNLVTLCQESRNIIFFFPLFLGKSYQNFDWEKTFSFCDHFS